MINKLRYWLLVTAKYWLIRKLISYDDKYLLVRAISDKIEELESASVKYKWIDKHDIDTDCYKYKVLKDMLKIDEWS